MRHSFLAALLVLTVFTAPAAAHEATATASSEAQISADQGSASNMVAVGHNDIGGRGFNADVWVHDEHAYVGSWGFSDWAQGDKDRFCPAGDMRGVAVIDARDPSDPQRVATLLQPEGTSAEDVVVFTAKYGPQRGRDFAVAGIQVCGGSRYDEAFFRGLMVWDVTNPARPVEVGRLSTGCCTRGLHEFEVQHRSDLKRTFVYATVPASEYADSFSPTGRRDVQGRGDFRLIDVTDPSRASEVSNWGVHKNLGGPTQPGRGCDPDAAYGHGAEPSVDGRLAFLSYWDSGFIALDLSNPARPLFRGNTVYPPNADGDAHSSNYDENRRLLFTADEDFCKTSGAGVEKGFGYLRVYDYSTLSAPRQIGEYRTPNSVGADDQKAGDYTIHNPLIAGTDLYVSWYTDGIRVLDASDPRALREVAHFVPPSANNPVQPSQRGVLTNTTQVWGVARDESTGLIYASDMNSGLWILKRTGP